MEYYVVINKSLTIEFSGKWTKLENNILHEVAQTLKDKQHIFSLICES